MTTAPVLVAANLVKSFTVRGWLPGRPGRQVDALRGVDLTIRRGSIHGIIGANGSGKSTFLRIVATLVLPDSGTVTVAGHDVVADASAVRRLIGLSTGEERSLYWRLSPRQNLEFAAALYGIPAPASAIESVLDLVGLADNADRPVSGFSQGMCRRLGLARALLHEPHLLLLDEPTRSLDPTATADFHGVLRAIQRERGVTTVMSTHDLEEAASCCDEVSALREGQINGQVSPASEARPHRALAQLV
ncbi:MAG TPA: ABC transporter ATP-binding protein [Mycobacteriales bacterium]|nr:ABC transporter ATP-binding protein [Mycobacteriales bacterium]